MKRLNYKNVRRIMWIIFGIGFLIMLSALCLPEPAATAVILLGALCLGAGFVLLFRFWRCPHCEHLLPTREGGIIFCPHCGEKL